MRRMFPLLLSVLAAGVVASAQAQTYPTRPIKLLVNNAPGGGTDIMARVLAEALKEDLGQPVIVENKVGAGGALGAAEAARAAPDGYTVLVSAGAFAIAPSVLKNAGYDPVKDFIGVAQIAIVPLIVLTRPDSPLNSLADLVALARKDGDKVSFAETLKFQDNEIRITYSGTLAGDEMKLVREVGDFAKEDVVAKRETK